MISYSKTEQFESDFLSQNLMGANSDRWKNGRQKTTVQFTVLTFCIAYLVSGALIALGQRGYYVYNRVHSLQEFALNIPFAIYILLPAIASYGALKRNNKIAGFKEWLKTVFYTKNNIHLYLFVIVGLALYFLIHIVVSGHATMALYVLYLLSFPARQPYYRWVRRSWLDVCLATCT